MQKELQRIEFIVNEFLFVSKPQATHFVTSTLDSIVMSTMEFFNLKHCSVILKLKQRLTPDLPPVYV